MAVDFLTDDWVNIGSSRFPRQTLTRLIEAQNSFIKLCSYETSQAECCVIFRKLVNDFCQYNSQLYGQEKSGKTGFLETVRKIQEILNCRHV